MVNDTTGGQPKTRKPDADGPLSTPADLRAAAQKRYQDSLADLARQRQEIRKAYRSDLAKVSEAERKLDTRRKIILGAALLDHAAADPLAHDLLARLLQNLPRDQDKQAFADWTLPPRPPSRHLPPLKEPVILPDPQRTT